MMARQEEKSLTEDVSRWTPGTYLAAQHQRQRELDAWHAHLGGDIGENALGKAESMGAKPCLSETAFRRLRFEKHLGQGAFGAVIQVVCTTDGSRHALKLAKDAGEGSLGQKTEMAALLRLGEHRNIVPVHYMDDAQKGLPIVFGLGLFDLEDIVRDKRPATQLQKCMLLMDVAHGLRHAHQHNVLHCDIKPSNVIVFPGPNGGLRAKISDWGLALSIAEERRPWRGTIGIIPPEAARDTAAVLCSPDQDTYSLGHMFLQMFAIGPLKSDNIFMNLLMWPPAARAGYQGLAKDERDRRYRLQTLKNATDGVSLAKMLQPACFSSELQQPLLFCRLVGRMLSPQPRLRPPLLAVSGLLPKFAQPFHAEISNAGALPASALGREDSRGQRPLAMRTTDGVDMDRGHHPAATTLARRRVLAASLQSTTSAIAVVDGRRGGIVGGVSGPARVRAAAALAAAETAAVAAAKRVLLSAQQQAFAESAATAVATVGKAAETMAAPTPPGGGIGHADTFASAASHTQGGPSSRLQPPSPPSSSQNLGGRRGPVTLSPRTRNNMAQVKLALPGQSGGETRLPPPQTPPLLPRPQPPSSVVVDPLPSFTPETFRAAVFARAIAQRLEKHLAEGRNAAAVGPPTPLETIRETDAGLIPLSSEGFSSSPSRSRLERAAAAAAAAAAAVEHEDEEENGGRLGLAFVPSSFAARDTTDSTASVRILRGGATENYNVGSRPSPAKCPTSRKPSPPLSSLGVGAGGRKRSPLLLSPRKGNVTGTKAAASDAMACGWYCEGPARRPVRAGVSKQDEGDGIAASSAYRCSQQLTLSYAHGGGVTTGHHRHGHCGEGERQVAATAVAAAGAAATPASTARTGTAAPGFDEGRKRLGFPQRASGHVFVRTVPTEHGASPPCSSPGKQGRDGVRGKVRGSRGGGHDGAVRTTCGQGMAHVEDANQPEVRWHGQNVAQLEAGVGPMSVNHPSWVVRRGAAAAAAATMAAPAPGFNRNRPRPKETSQNLTSRLAAAGSPSSHRDDNSGIGGRPARARNHVSGFGDFEEQVQRTGRRTRRGKRRRKKGGGTKANTNTNPTTMVTSVAFTAFRAMPVGLLTNAANTINIPSTINTLTTNTSTLTTNTRTNTLTTNTINIPSTINTLTTNTNTTNATVATSVVFMPFRARLG